MKQCTVSFSSNQTDRLWPQGKARIESYATSYLRCVLTKSEIPELRPGTLRLNKFVQQEIFTAQRLQSIILE